MPFAPEETSLFDGTPVELYYFRSDDAQEQWAFTSGDEVLIDGVLRYTPIPISRSGLQSSTAEAQGQIRVTIPADEPAAKKFIAYLPERQMLLTILHYHRSDAAAEKIPVFIGTVNSVEFENGQAILSCQPVTKGLTRSVPWQSYKALCNWPLYGPGCGVLRTAFQTVLPTGPQFVEGDIVRDNAFSAQANGWYTNGYIEVVETRETRFIISHTTNELRLIYPFTNYQEGMEVRAYAGCDRSEATCRTKFNNIANYLGFNRVPTVNPFNTSFSGEGSTAPRPTSFADVIRANFRQG
jgi:uncharacterized phage protein (TIGR02218 family)